MSEKKRDFIPCSVELFQAATIGRLMAGTVHNINGPLQIISMQIELLKMELEGSRDSILGGLAADDEARVEIARAFARHEDRLNKIRASLAKLEEIASQQAVRAKKGGDEAPFVQLSQLVLHSINFWRGDLFFKHEVEYSLEIDPEIYLPYPPTLLCFLLDVAMARAVYEVKRLRGARLRLFSAFKEGGGIELNLAWEGEPSGQDVSSDDELERQLLEMGMMLAEREGGKNSIEMRSGPGRVSMLFRSQSRA